MVRMELFGTSRISVAHRAMTLLKINLKMVCAMCQMVMKNLASTHVVIWATRTRMLMNNSADVINAATMNTPLDRETS